MATTKPTSSTQWASDPGAPKAAPGVGVQAQGLPKGAVVPAELLNGQLDQIDAWLAYLRSQGETFDSIRDLVESDALEDGDLGTVRGDASGRPLDDTWGKTAASFGSAEAVRLVSDGARVMVALPGNLYAFDPLDGTDLHSGAFFTDGAYGASPRLACDGRYLYAVSDSVLIRVLDPTTNSGAQLGVITHSDTLIDLCADGTRLYVIDDQDAVVCYEDLFDTPSVAWTNTIAGVTGLLCVATNGYLVAVGHDHNGTGNLTLYDADGSGTPLATLEFDSVGTPDVVRVAFTRDHLLAWTSNGKLYLMPAWEAAASTLASVELKEVSRGSAGGGTELLEVAPVQVSVCGEYMAQAHNSGTSGYVALFRLPKDGADLVPLGIKIIGSGSADTIKDIALGPDHLVVAHKGTSTLSAFSLPSRGQPRRYRKATSTDRYRAPWYGAVVEEG